MRPGTLLRWYALNRILESLISNSSIILDIGGFDGYILHQINKIIAGKDITVIDLDKQGLKIAQDMGLKTIESSALDLPFQDNYADLVLCLDLLEHVEDDNGVLREVSRVLKYDGTIILTTPMERGVPFLFMNTKRIDEINKGWGHIRLGYSRNQINQMFLQNGFEILKITSYFNFLTRLIYRFTFLSTHFRLQQSIYECVIKLEPYIKLGSKEYIIIARKGTT